MKSLLPIGLAVLSLRHLLLTGKEEKLASDTAVSLPYKGLAKLENATKRVEGKESSNKDNRITGQ